MVKIGFFFGQKKAWHAVCAYFGPFLVFSGNLPNFHSDLYSNSIFENNAKKSQKSKKNEKMIFF